MPLFEIPLETGGNIVSTAKLVKALRHIEREPYNPIISMGYKALNKRSQMAIKHKTPRLGDSGLLAPATAIGTVGLYADRCYCEQSRQNQGDTANIGR